ncbi:MAG: hypothetical protein KY455_04500 [Euryarchaeota archaeon]|nr:hypothetical protein [Euryarchaeota archaeon]
MVPATIAHDPPTETTGHYVAWQVPGLIACAAGEYPAVPQGDPDDHSSPLTWLFSGEPECLPGSVLFGKENDHGWGGSVFCVAGEWKGRDCGDHVGHTIRITADDAVPDAKPPLLLYLVGEDADGRAIDITVEGCGTVEGVIPVPEAPHFPPDPDVPQAYLVWVKVANVQVDATTTEICIGTTGVITGAY